MTQYIVGRLLIFDCATGSIPFFLRSDAPAAHDVSSCVRTSFAVTLSSSSTLDDAVELIEGNASALSGAPDAHEEGVPVHLLCPPRSAARRVVEMIYVHYDRSEDLRASQV